MKFVSLAAIVKFDDMYAAALFENKIKKLVGAKLNITFKRWMVFDAKKEKNDDDLEDEIEDVRQPNPRKGSILLKIMSFIHKMTRILYVSF